VYQKILSIEPDYQDVKIHYAHCLLSNDQVNDAEKEVSKILKSNPDNINAQVILGNLYKTKGKFAEAEDVYEKILEVDRYFHSALAGLASCKKFTDINDDLIKLLYEAVSRNKSASIYFALGKINNDLGEYDLAFDAYKKANDIKNRKADFNPEQHTAYIDAIINVFTKELVERLQVHGNPSELPVFIIGTPRSGTTLTEQIISSHPMVNGAGELRYIGVLAKNILRNQLTDTKYPERIAYLMPEDIQKEAAIYLDKIKSHQSGGGIIRITDKMPGNFLCLGYILILFPNARIIHCRRNPLDSCLSIYFQSFNAGHQYSFNLANLGYWYKDYLRLMQHWKKIFGDRILDVDYDLTVNDTETTARKLIEFCDLEWDEKCLEFHKQDRAIRTASQWQVRQPIYKTSLERWKRYDKHIGVLKEILAGLY
jgi:tetratricopeptide (TPR) repeat protein